MVLPGPDTGQEDDSITHFLSDMLERTGRSRPVLVTIVPEAAHLRASVRLDNGDWLISPIPDTRPPPGGWKVLAGWIAAIICGSTIISVYVVTKIIHPPNCWNNRSPWLVRMACYRPSRKRGQVKRGPRPARSTAFRPGSGRLLKAGCALWRLPIMICDPHDAHAIAG